MYNNSFRRSRSRSPNYTASRSPRRYGSDTHKDYDYDRDRWPPYDRDGDLGSRRGRSRSPAPDDLGRKRRRSLSPYDRDRYEPRPRYDDFDSRPHNSPPRRGPHGRRAPEDPYTMGHPASLKQFAEWFRYTYPQQAAEEDEADKLAEQKAGDGSKPRNGLRSKWEKYKKEFAGTQLQTMFDHHRKSPWFCEKYDPAEEFAKLRTRVRKEGWKGRIHAFLQDLETGKFDPNLHEPEESVAKETTNGDVPKDVNGTEEPKTTAEDEIQEVDEDTQESKPETNGKTSPEKRQKSQPEEASVEPEGNQVMIRTIPPDIGRLKLEEACDSIPGFVHLALGDPMQKRNFYRAGWVKFKDDADMSAVMSELGERKIEGFRLQVTHNTRPFTSRIREAPEVASKPDRIQKDLDTIKYLASVLEEQAAGLRRLNLKAEELPKEGDAEATNGHDTHSETGLEEEADPPESASEAVERRVEKIMSDIREQNLIDVNDDKAFEDRKNVVALDLYIAYIRAAYHTCYYCCVTTDHLEELQRKCIKHVRRPMTKSMVEDMKREVEKGQGKEQDIAMGTTEDILQSPVIEKEGEKKKDEKDRRKRNTGDGDDKWLEWLDSKLQLLINRDGVDPREYGGKNYDEELKKAVEPHIKQEDEGKYRCRTCLKLFKAGSFVEKHIVNKHPEHVKALDELPFFNNFALDPHRIQPFAHLPPPSYGNNHQAPPQAYGIQGPVERYGRGDGFYHGHSNNWNDHGRRDDGNAARRLSDRISGYTEMMIPAGAGLPPKPPPPSLDSALSSGNQQRRGGRGGHGGGAPPPPPPNVREDPRASAGRRVSYHDMDLVAEGDVELSY